MDSMNKPVAKLRIKVFSAATALVVEDNSINQLVVREILRDKGVTVIFAENGQKALQILRQTPIDFVLMDIQMPIMDGFQATMEIRRQEQFVNLPIIAMTAHSGCGFKTKCISAGMNGFVVKPIALEALYIELAEWFTADGGLPLIPVQSEAVEQGRSVISGLPGINCDVGLAKVGNNYDLYYKILKAFYQDHSGSDIKIQELMRNNEHQAIRKLAHTLKGVSGNIGALDLFSAADALGIALNNKTAISEALYDFRTALQIVIEGLAEFTQQEKPVNTVFSDKIDLSVLVPLLNDLVNKLKMHSFGAANMLPVLKQLLGGHLFNLFSSLEEQIDAFHFEEAEKTLQQMYLELQIMSDWGRNG